MSHSDLLPTLNWSCCVFGQQQFCQLAESLRKCMSWLFVSNFWFEFYCWSSMVLNGGSSTKLFDFFCSTTDRYLVCLSRINSLQVNEINNLFNAKLSSLEYYQHLRMTTVLQSLSWSFSSRKTLCQNPYYDPMASSYIKNNRIPPLGSKKWCFSNSRGAVVV